MLSENNIIQLKQAIQTSLWELSKPTTALLTSQEKLDSCTVIEDIYYVQQPTLFW